MSTETFKNSGVCVCAYCKEDIDLTDYDTLVMNLTKYIGIDQDFSDSIRCEQKIITHGRLISIVFHRKCLVEFFKDSPIAITERMIRDIGESYPTPSDREEQIKRLIKRSKGEI